MSELMNIFVVLFGVPLGFLFEIFGNYGVAIIVFTLLVNFILFPFSIKRQRELVGNLKYEFAKDELKRKYGNDIQRYSTELMAYNTKEGIKPFKGVFGLPLFIMIIFFTGISSTMQKPLTSILKIPNEKINQISDKLLLTDELEKNRSSTYELQIIKKIDKIKDNIDVLSEKEKNDIEKLKNGFNFLGLNLLNVPKKSKFNELLWILPLICLILSILNVRITQKNSSDISNGGFGIYLLSSFQAWMVFTMYGAIGVYWIISSLIGIFQTVIIERYFSIYINNAKKEFKLYKKLSLNESV